ncbi:hypothetical Protein YC6258_02976 [Gynuella sunshinyii YC6258]|uniref:Uncharacterized protein n=1 Tax=Gynuella sunshinyii YC6258 TaxID=1445510 RepID=A0A0C5VX40_9GAMM|nr:hypothetical Protein YC6258_02976 [Gynuella sunshinyii YC6258]
MKKWKIHSRPPLDECPRHYCFCWCPPGAAANLSDKKYGSFEEAVNSTDRVIFSQGGCAAPFGKCRRETKVREHPDRYEPFERVLKSEGLPELYFCNPDNLDVEDKAEYQKMVTRIWNDHV